MGRIAAVAFGAILVLSAATLQPRASASTAAFEAFPAPGLYKAVRADIVETGRACGNGAPLSPSYVLKVGPANAVNAPSAIAVLRDAGGVAMPVAPRSATEAYVLADLTEPPPSNALGELVVLQAHPSTWIAVDYRYLDSHCRVTGTIVFEAVDDATQAAQIDALVQAMDAKGRRDALRAAGKSRDAMGPGLIAQSLLALALGPEHWLTLNAGTNLASLHWDVDEFAIARERYEALIPRIAAALGPDNFQVWRARQNLALVLWDQGEYDAAEAILKSVAERYDSMLGADDVHALGTLTNLATLVNQRGRIVEAERIMFDVVQRLERVQGPEHPRTLLSLNNLATILVSAGRYEDALLHYTTAVERYRRALGPRHPATLRAEHNRYFVMSRTGQRSEGMEGVRGVLGARREALGPQHSETLVTQQVLATMIGEDGALAEAAELQRAVAAGREAASGPLHTETLLANGLLGRLEVKLGQVPAGLDRMRSAHARASDALGRRDRTTLELGALLGNAERDAGELAASRATLTSVVEGVERWREEGALTASGRRDLFSRWVPAYKSLAAVHFALGDARAAFEQAERSKARVLIETLALRRGEVRDVLPPDALAALARLDRQLAEIETDIAKAPRDASARFPLEQRRTVSSAESSALRKELRVRYPKYAALSEARVVGATEGARQLPAGAVFASYLRDGDRVLVFTIDRRGQVIGHDLGEMPGLDDAVIAYRTLLAPVQGATAPPVWRLPDGRYRVALAAPDNAVRVRDANILGEELASRFVAPVPELLRARRWILSPDSALALIPFETLPHHGRPLLATREISYAPSLSVYSLTAQRGRDYDRLSGRAPLYAMGAAIYEDGPRSTRATAASVPLGQLEASLAIDPDGVRRAYDVMGARWPNLPQSATELRDVATRFRGSGEVTVRTRNQATEKTLREDDRNGTLARHRYVLLSAHGYLSTEAPSLSAVVLGQTDVTPDADGYVTAAEWTGYTLRSDLIVISACETGAGRIIAGEGVAGLPYALFVAGNRNVLLTLWPVADKSTALFVSRFFGHLRRGMSQPAALARTKREFASSGPYTAPLHWAPFVLWGA